MKIFRFKSWRESCRHCGIAIAGPHGTNLRLAIHPDSLWLARVHKPVLRCLGALIVRGRARLLSSKIFPNGLSIVARQFAYRFDA